MDRKKVIERVIWSCAVAACLLTITVLAQAEFRNGEPPPPVPEKILERLRKDFRLTEEQAAKVRGFMDESVKQEEEVLQRYGLNREQFQILQNDFRMARDDFFKKLETVLTEEQKKSCGHHGNFMGGHRPPSPPPY